MAFLAPSLIGQADAKIDTTATTQVGHFINTEVELFEGKFTNKPSIPFPNVVTWGTTSTGIIGGDETGMFRATVVGFVGDGYPYSFVVYFTNPLFGSNYCAVGGPTAILQATCNISSGNSAKLTITVVPRTQQNDNNYCDILPKLGGLDQSKIIKEKISLLKCD